MRSPSAVAEISLSDEDRLRIAKDLGLDETQLDAIPRKLDIARYEVEEGDVEPEGDVEGFAFDAAALSFSKTSFNVQSNNIPALQVAHLNKFILVAV